MENTQQKRTRTEIFVTLNEKLEMGLAALQSKHDRLESYLQFLAKHLNVALPE